MYFIIKTRGCFESIGNSKPFLHPPLHCHSRESLLLASSCKDGMGVILFDKSLNWGSPSHFLLFKTTIGMVTGRYLNCACISQQSPWDPVSSNFDQNSEIGLARGPTYLGQWSGQLAGTICRNGWFKSPLKGSKPGSSHTLAFKKRLPLHENDDEDTPNAFPINSYFPIPSRFQYFQISRKEINPKLNILLQT